LRRNPYAVDIFKRHEPGRVYIAEVVDHIIPHKGDPVLFWSVSNLQGLTRSDHNRKTAMEDGGFGHSTERVVLVCGAPGSGKTTYVDQHRSPGDLVWDLDLVAQSITGLGIHERSPGSVPFLLALREAFYGEAKKPSLARQIWIVESCPTLAERERFQRELKARIVLLDTPESVCIERLRLRGPEWPARATEWWAKHNTDALLHVRPRGG